MTVIVFYHVYAAIACIARISAQDDLHETRICLNSTCRQNKDSDKGSTFIQTRRVSKKMPFGSVTSLKPKGRPVRSFTMPTDDFGRQAHARHVAPSRLSFLIGALLFAGAAGTVVLLFACLRLMRSPPWQEAAGIQLGMTTRRFCINLSAVGDDEEAEPLPNFLANNPAEDVGTSMAQTVFNIMKSIVGEGMLSLPVNVAVGTSVPIGSCITVVLGLIFGYTFIATGRVCHATGSETHKECAAAVSGPFLAQTMAALVMLKTASTCIVFLMVCADSFSRAFEFCGVHDVYSTRQIALFVCVFGILLPLCLQKDLSILSCTSLIGVLCEMFVVSFMSYRLLDGSYTPGGKYYDSVPNVDRAYHGELDEPNLCSIPASTIMLIAALSDVFVAHYNAPKFYAQMRNRSPRRFAIATSVAFFTSLLILAWMVCVAYLTFGAHTGGNVLNSYARGDPGAAAAMIAISFAVLFSFPLAFTALRDCVFSMFTVQPDEKRNFLRVTFVLLATITVLAASFTDFGFGNALDVIMFCPTITLIFPGLLVFFLAPTIRQDYTKSMKGDVSNYERCWSLCVVGIGGWMMCFGTYILMSRKAAPQVLQ